MHVIYRMKSGAWTYRAEWYVCTKDTERQGMRGLDVVSFRSSCSKDERYLKNRRKKTSNCGEGWRQARLQAPFLGQ